MNGTPEKIICSKCGQKMNISELQPFDEFPCPRCKTITICPKIFDRYYLLEVCGIGGRSKVYRAIDPEINTSVAIKITNSDLIDQTHLERFAYEAKLVSSINHPGIVRTFRGGVFENQPFLVMEFMKKGTLEGLQQDFMLPPSEKILHWLAIIADGLHAASKLGIVHHDVKPANIMLSEDGDVKIGDFDLAEINTDSNSDESANWVSIAFVSPERVMYGREDYRGDIFSLGATAYELLTGEYPFGNTGDADEIIERRREFDFPPVCTLNSTVSASMSDFITEMMSFDPELRPSYPEIVHMFRSNGKSRKSAIRDISFFPIFKKSSNQEN